MVDTQDVVLSVPDVSCEHCVKAVGSAVGGLPGVENVRTDLQTKTVHVRFHPAQVSLQQIESALDEAGYSVAK
ncbi:MAG: heavy-metal-associated domain-containing protein [Ktedonobacteraceae bacterium]|nr:heavy-metal-associated domain-containing protein [Ktedonobacteraceae bacterium]